MMSVHPIASSVKNGMACGKVQNCKKHQNLETRFQENHQPWQKIFQEKSAHIRRKCFFF